MNQWMSAPFEYPSTPMDRGKVLTEKDIQELKGNWGRYADKDGDGIPYRTLPGNQHPMSAYFTRGTGHDENARYSEEAQVFHSGMERLKLKHETAKKYVPAPVVRETRGAEVGIIAYGSTESAVEEARTQLFKAGLKTSLMRLRALPFTKEVDKFLKKYEQIIVVEMNRDGQMCQLLCADYPTFAHKMYPVAYQDGLPASAKWIREGIQKFVKPAAKKKTTSKKKVPARKATKTIARKGASK